VGFLSTSKNLLFKNSLQNMTENKSIIEKTKTWIKKHPIITVLLTVFIIIPLITGIVENVSKAPDKIKNSPTNQERVAQAKEQYDILVKQFNHETDKFDGSESYTHKNNASGKNTLSVSVTGSGDIYMSSLYNGDTWISHNQVQVKIGNKLYESNTGMTSKNISGNGVYEITVYQPLAQGGIIEAIAESGDQEVSVRLLGNRTKDFTLTSTEKTAIQDSYKLSTLLNIIN